MSIRSTFFGIEIGKSGLNVSQKGLDVTGHNISNVETAGYTRQRIVNTAYAPYSAITQLRIADTARVGAGAHVQILDQIRSSFLDRQFRTEQTAASYWSTRSQGLTYVQSLFETSTGDLALTTSVNDLFSAFNAVSNAPEDQQQRTFLRQQALKMTEQFKHMYESMMALQEGQNTSVKTVTDQINTIAGQIADLNKNIFAFEIDGQPANDLRDKRNLLVDQLAGLADVTYEGDAIGAKFSLSIGGKTLVSHKLVNTLNVREVPNAMADDPLAGPVFEVYWEDYIDPATGDDSASGEALDLSQLTGGELLSHIKLRDSTAQEDPGIPYFIQEINALAQALVQNINTLHRQGWTHPAADAGGVSRQGVDFFAGAVEKPDLNNPIVDENGDPVLDGDGNPTYGTYLDVSAVTAGNIDISDALKESVYNIAASSDECVLDDSDSGKLKVGNNKTMSALFNLQVNPSIQLIQPDTTAGAAAGATVNRGIGTFSGQISSITMDIATTLNNTDKKVATGTTLLLAADTQRTSISGVSLDEEMTSLIKYNHAYNGASRVITAMDEALDRIINSMGLVGRS